MKLKTETEREESEHFDCVIRTLLPPHLYCKNDEERRAVPRRGAENRGEKRMRDEVKKKKEDEKKRKRFSSSHSSFLPLSLFE